MNQKLIYSLANACIVGGIVFLSTLPGRYPPDAQALYQAAIGSGLALLTQVKTILEALTNGGNGGTGNNEDSIYGVPIVKSEQDKKLKLGMLI